VAAQNGALAFLRRSLSLFLKIKSLRSDSAFYQAAVIDGFAERGIGYTITADQHAGVKEVIKTVGNWKPLLTAGRLVRHGRRLILRLATSLEKYRMFLQVRRLCATFR
jgi:hypothetical protein